MYPREPTDLAHNLIGRSRGIFGDFKMPRCAQIIRQEGLGFQLDDAQINRILKRYREHVNFWRVGFNTVIRELKEFASASGKDSWAVLREFVSTAT